MEGHTAEQTKSHLEQAAKDLGQLIDHVSEFADWWTSVRFNIIALQNTLPKLVGNSEVLRTSNVRTRWTEIQQQYLLYSRRVRISPLGLGCF
jgi:hypothetical protein